MNELTIEKSQRGLPISKQFDNAKVSLIRETMCKEATDNEFALFIAQCEQTGLDPLTRQIYLVGRYNRKLGREVFATQASIDGLRVIADRTGLYAGQLGPYYYNAKREWVDVWVEKYPPLACKVGVLRKDFAEPLWADASWQSYAQLDYEKKPTHMWEKFSALMLAKCAEALALRKAFPQHIGGLYTEDEMAQADNEDFQINTKSTVLSNVTTTKKEEKSYPVEKIIQSWQKNGRIGNDERSIESAREAVAIIGDTPVLESNSEEWTSNFMKIYEGIKAGKESEVDESKLESEIETVANELGGVIKKTS